MDSIIKSDLQRSIARDEGGHHCDTEMMIDDSVGYSPIQVLLYETVEAVHLCHCKRQGRVVKRVSWYIDAILVLL